MSANKRYLLIKGEAGLGNRILSLLSGMEYARLSGRIPVIEWCNGDYAEAGENAFFELFKQTERIGSVCELPLSGTVTPEIWEGSLFESPFDKIAPAERVKASKLLILFSFILKRLKGSAFSFQFPWSYRKVCIDLTRIDQPQTIGIFFAFTEKFYRLKRLYRLKKDPLISQSHDEKMRLVFERELHLKEDLAEEIRCQKKLLLTGKTIGVHLRFTDRQGSLRRAFADIRKTVAAYPGWNLFLATDNQCIEDALRIEYPDLLTMKKWFPVQGGPIHKSKNCQNKISMAREALKEILLLSSCDYILYMGHSTFSVLAKALSGLPESRTLDLNRFHILNRLVLFLHRVC